MEWLFASYWSPYTCGIGIGIVSWLAFYLSDTGIGVSTAYARTAGMIEQRFKRPGDKEKEYYREFTPMIDWEWMLVAGLFFGALLSSVTAGTFRLHILPETWIAGFGATPGLRLFTAIFGGFILIFGARWAGGCTSGHGITGTLQLALSSWIAILSFFIAGIITAFALY